MANNTATPAKKQPAVPPVAIVIGVVVVAGLAGFLYLERAATQPPAAPPPLTGPAKEYVKFLKFVSADGQTVESPQMTAHESYMKLSVVEITGNIQNTGDRVLELVEINCVFTDPYGQVLLRERVPIVSKKMGKLSPGETKSFRLAFDNVPEGWNQAMPQMVIARIDFS
ncbi:MAG TPA: DUF3426 domain-containing protein [Bryobacteraceae bacterium]